MSPTFHEYVNYVIQIQINQMSWVEIQNITNKNKIYVNPLRASLFYETC